MRVFRITVLLLIAASMNYVIGFAIAKWAPRPAGVTNFYPIAGYVMDGLTPSKFEEWRVPPCNDWDLVGPHLGKEQLQLIQQEVLTNRHGAVRHHLSPPLAELSLDVIGSGTWLQFGNQRTVQVFGFCATLWPGAYSNQVTMVGLPFRSLVGSMQYCLRYDPVNGRHGSSMPDFSIAIGDPESKQVRTTYDGRTQNLGGRLYHLVPLRPIPAGFIANTSIYFAILLLACRGISTIAQRWRGRSGHCRSCGYDVAGLDTCPECGREVELNGIAVG